MIITRQRAVPWSWVGFAHLPWAAMLFASAANPIGFALEIRKFTANPAAISTLLTLTGFMTMFAGPLVNWISDRIWTRFGRRKIFYVPAVLGQATLILFVPFAPNLGWLAFIYLLQYLALSFKAPNEVLNQEIIPNHQRGRAAVFNKIYVQFGLMAYNVALIGRFDDILPNAPIRRFVNTVSGEVLIFVVFALALLSVVFLIGLGVKEIKPKYMRDMREELGGRITPWRIVRKLFIDVFSAEWWPLYLLALSQAMYGVKLGGMVALMYTDQWGYSTQILGFTQGTAQLVSIFVVMLVFPIADKFDKLKFYLICVWLGMLGKILWYAYVMLLVPDNRPSVMEILIVGEGINILGQLAGIISYPLVYEFIPLNKLGTASAGLGIFRGLMGMIIGPLLGLWLLYYSNIFMPGAGSNVTLILAEPVTEQRMEVMAEDWEAQTGQRIWVDIFKPFGLKVDESRQWAVRIRDKEAEALQLLIDDTNLRLRDAQNEIDSARIRGETNVQALIAAKAVVQEELDGLRAAQAERAETFRAFLEGSLGTSLASLEKGVESVAINDRHIDLVLHTAFPVGRDSIDSLEEQLSLKLNWGKGAVEIARAVGDPHTLLVTGTVPAELEADATARPEIAMRVNQLLADNPAFPSDDVARGACLLASATADVVSGMRNNLLMAFPGSSYKPQKVDYFSSYLLMAATDVIAILIAMYLIRAEKTGKIQRRGKIEDEASSANIVSKHPSPFPKQ